MTSCDLSSVAVEFY